MEDAAQERQAGQADDAGRASTSAVDAQYNDVIKTNEWLAQENAMLEAYLRRVHPNMDFSAAADRKPARGRRKAESAKAQFVALSAEEKANICSHELDAALQKVSEVEKKGQDEIAEIKTMLEEVDVRQAEARKESHDFKRAVVLGAEDPRTKATQADAFVRFMEDRIKAKGAMIEKIELKNAQLKGQRAKLSQRVAQKEELCDMLHVVDFEQLQIENQQCLERVDAKNRELLDVKVTTGSTVQALNAIKAELSELLAAQARLERERRERATQLATFAADFKAADEERRAAEALIRRLTLEQQDTDQPHILDYIRLKHDNMELSGKKADMRRKADIADMDKRRTLRILKTVGAVVATPQ